MVKASSAMDGEAAMPDEKERRQARNDRLEAQLAMLEAAWRGVPDRGQGAAAAVTGGGGWGT